jgi:hypothetical protein
MYSTSITWYGQVHRSGAAATVVVPPRARPLTLALL